MVVCKNLDMGCDVISRKYQSGEFTLRAEGKLEISKRSIEIIDKDEVVKNFTCKKVCQYSSYKSCTSNLLKHKCQTVTPTLWEYLEELNHLT